MGNAHVPCCPPKASVNDRLNKSDQKGGVLILSKSKENDLMDSKAKL